MEELNGKGRVANKIPFYGVYHYGDESYNMKIVKPSKGLSRMKKKHKVLLEYDPVERKVRVRSHKFDHNFEFENDWAEIDVDYRVVVGL